MKPQLLPWQLLLVNIEGWVNRRQEDAIDYLRTENRVVREQLRKQRIRLDDEQRRRLAVKGRILGRKMLEERAGIVAPEAVVRWHREPVARHWDYNGRRKAVGRPPVTVEIVEPVLQLAKKSPTWGYRQVQGALANLGHLSFRSPISFPALGAYGIPSSHSNAANTAPSASALSLTSQSTSGSYRLSSLPVSCS